jgi:hypothetical protein
VSDNIATDSTQYWLTFCVVVVTVFALGFVAGITCGGVWVPKN